MAANHKTNLMSLPNELLLDIIDWLHVLNVSDVITANKREKVKGGITKKAMMAEKQRLKNGLSVLNLSQVNRRLYHLALPEFLGKSTWRFVTQSESPPANMLFYRTPAAFFVVVAMSVVQAKFNAREANDCDCPVDNNGDNGSAGATSPFRVYQCAYPSGACSWGERVSIIIMHWTILRVPLSSTPLTDNLGWYPF